MSDILSPHAPRTPQKTFSPRVGTPTYRALSAVAPLLSTIPRLAFPIRQHAILRNLFSHERILVVSDLHLGRPPVAKDGFCDGWTVDQRMSAFAAFIAAQRPHTIIFNGDTFELFERPLADLEDIVSEYMPLFRALVAARIRLVFTRGECDAKLSESALALCMANNDVEVSPDTLRVVDTALIQFPPPAASLFFVVLHGHQRDPTLADSKVKRRTRRMVRRRAFWHRHASHKTLRRLAGCEVSSTSTHDLRVAVRSVVGQNGCAGCFTGHTYEKMREQTDERGFFHVSVGRVSGHADMGILVKISGDGMDEEVSVSEKAKTYHQR